MGVDISSLVDQKSYALLFKFSDKLDIGSGSSRRSFSVNRM